MVVTTAFPSIDVLRQRADGLWAALPDDVVALAAAFEAAGHELALVGGPVRDAFLGRSSTDLDFATSALPDQTERAIRAWGGNTWDIGREFGTIGGRKGDTVVEITTYRADSYGEHSRKPEVAFGDSLEGDLARRDFTMNAMAVRLPSLAFVDPFDGLADLSAGVLRTPIEPDLSFSDDPLRMMRAARFVSQLGATVEATTLGAIERLADRIAIVSAERVRDELTKMMLGENPRRGSRSSSIAASRITSFLSFPRFASRRTSITTTRTSTNTRSRSWTRRSRLRPGRTAPFPDPTSSCALPRCSTTSGSRRRVGSSPAGR